jgi:hypothetical protein
LANGVVLERPVLEALFRIYRAEYAPAYVPLCTTSAQKSVYTVPKYPLLGHWEAVAVCVIQLVRAAVNPGAPLLGLMDPS